MESKPGNGSRILWSSRNLGLVYCMDGVMGTSSYANPFHLRIGREAQMKDASGRGRSGRRTVDIVAKVGYGARPQLQHRAQNFGRWPWFIVRLLRTRKCNSFRNCEELRNGSASSFQIPRHVAAREVLAGFDASAALAPAWGARRVELTRCARRRYDQMALPASPLQAILRRFVRQAAIFFFMHFPGAFQ
jgi:hypothetical protein